MCSVALAEVCDPHAFRNPASWASGSSWAPATRSAGTPAEGTPPPLQTCMALQACWSQWKNVTLHDARQVFFGRVLHPSSYEERLALADLLDVPFQALTLESASSPYLNLCSLRVAEDSSIARPALISNLQEITRVSMTFHASAGRRLSTDKLATFQAGTDTVGRVAGGDLQGAARWP